MTSLPIADLLLDVGEPTKQATDPARKIPFEDSLFRTAFPTREAVDGRQEGRLEISHETFHVKRVLSVVRGRPMRGRKVGKTSIWFPASETQAFIHWT